MKSILPLSLYLAISLCSYGQVPSNVLKEFERMQPGARFIEWKEDKSLYWETLFKVTYTNWYRQTIYFTRNAQIMLTESELPSQYVPNTINDFITQYFPHSKCVVWDSFDERNRRSYFVIVNEERKLFFNDLGKYSSEVVLTKPKKPGLLTFFTGN